LKGAMISGATNIVHLRVASLPDFLVMKAHAVQSRDKPEDVYDVCYCLDEYPDGIDLVAADWRARADDPLVRQAIEILREKFETVDHFGPQQLAIFHDSTDQAARHACPAGF
jgi:predicted nucleotidyltransferase component of viral defense system